jgi:hypothetical protein
MKPLAGLATIILTAYAGLLSISQRSFAQEAIMRQSCIGAIDQVAKEMVALGATVKTDFRSSKKLCDLDLQGYAEVSFTLGALADLGTRRGHISRNIMNSPMLQLNYSRRIFSTCSSIGVVTFWLNHSGWWEAYVSTSSGKILRRFCSHERNHPTFARRATYIDHPVGRSPDGSCTYIYP